MYSTFIRQLIQPVCVKKHLYLTSTLAPSFPRLFSPTPLVSVMLWMQTIFLSVYPNPVYGLITEANHAGHRPHDTPPYCRRAEARDCRHVLFSGPLNVHSAPLYPPLRQRILTPLHRIVVVTSIVVAATASAVSDKFDRFSQVGGIIGTSVSAAFLILLGIMNVYILYRLVKQLNALLATHPSEEEDEDFKIHGAGCLFNIFKSMFKMIDRFVLSAQPTNFLQTN